MLNVLNPLKICTKQVFTFNHPKAQAENNRRYKKLIFEFPGDTGSALVHGNGVFHEKVLLVGQHFVFE